MGSTKSFFSDNCSGVHPDIIESILKANKNDVISYGNDLYTDRAILKFKEHFGEEIDVYFVFNGTAANVLALKSMTESFNSIICAESAHINVDECGAPEYFTGCKIVSIPTVDGKLTVDLVQERLNGFGNKHQNQPKIISISETTEFGTLYNQDEIRALATLAHNNGMLLHMDGARLGNAAASLNLTFKEITTEVGVDVLSFGGTKNGLMLGEAVVFINKELSINFQYIQKQGLQLASKMRFISAQFESLLSNNLWLRNAKNANQMARYLEDKLRRIPQVEIVQKVESNAVFAKIPNDYISPLHRYYDFHSWKEGDRSRVRWMTSFNTNEEDVNLFVEKIEQISNNHNSAS
jgi:threonine aldolase